MRSTLRFSPVQAETHGPDCLFCLRRTNPESQVKVDGLTMLRTSVFFGLLVCCTTDAAPAPERLQANPASQSVDPATMQRIYDEVKTPFKYGVVLRGKESKKVDCPSIFRRGDKWFMLYVCMNEVGYETHLAESRDLLHWQSLGKVLSFRKEGWDHWQADGGA